MGGAVVVNGGAVVVAVTGGAVVVTGGAVVVTGGAVTVVVVEVGSPQADKARSKPLTIKTDRIEKTSFFIVISFLLWISEIL